jgi:hypothetical protein
MTESSATEALGGVPRAMMELLGAELKLGLGLIESLTGFAIPDPERITGSLERLGRRARRGCCDIPPPCWMPQPLGDCVSHVSECKTACIRLEITNCDRVAHQVSVSATGSQAGNVTFTPASLQLGPMERGTIEACLSVPAGAPDCATYELILWVRGCREHFLRWRVHHGRRGSDSCHEVEVQDCPDWRHHWYDHFYCPRPCSHL